MAETRTHDGFRVGPATRRDGASRRGLLAGTAVAALGGMVIGGRPGSALAQAASSGAGPSEFDFPGKERKLSLLGDRPLVAETPEAMLDDDTTPTRAFFVRNNGQLPEAPSDPEAWTLRIDGEVGHPVEISLRDLKARFPHRTYRLVLECGGNGRSFYQPQTRGNPWTNGGVGCAEWTGVALADVLASVGLKPSALYTAHYGADPHLSGDPGKDSLSRGMPVAKALEPHNLLAFAMNGEPIPLLHGGPLRLVVPGWPGSLSHKWITRITLRDREHDGQGMTGTSYRVPVRPMVPGGKVDEANFRILESMPVRSIVTRPAHGGRMPAGTRDVAVRGAAWAGDLAVAKVEVSADGGQTWSAADLAAPRNRYDWQRWTASLKLPSDGYYEILSRATDAQGRTQPPVPTNWNPQGYGGNAMHRIAILVG